MCFAVGTEQLVVVVVFSVPFSFRALGGTVNFGHSDHI